MKRTIEHLYIHYPHCRHLCNYCDFYKTKKLTGEDNIQFESYMLQSLKIHEEFLSLNEFSWGKLKTLYIGGGTPSLWGESGSKFIETFFKNVVQLSEKNNEFTLEVNPGSWTEKSINEWSKVGVNRFSIGLQSTDDIYLKCLDRVHDFSEAKRTLEFFKSLKVNFSVDFMIGLPFSQSLKRNIVEELKSIFQYNPSHFSVYILTVGKHYPHYKNLPDENWIEKEYFQVVDTLKEFGYNQYEVSNFCLDGKESKHNMAYWNQKSVAALGPSSTGLLINQDNAIRYKWKTNETSFNVEELNREELLIEKVFLNLRSNIGLDLSVLGQLSSKQVQNINDWFRRRLLIKNGEKIRLTPRGLFQMDTLVNYLISEI
ncbi:MAG: coproporphyrinogen III oxidase family protein [Halobacteriovoraceae bacterium]|nr:coproporphyrinogen III oxidase family protein [Halobacteriovoraceae bacterium]